MKSGEIIPEGFRVSEWSNGADWVSLSKGNPIDYGDKGYGPRTYKVFVQPRLGGHEEMLYRALQVLSRESDIKAKFLDLGSVERWNIPEKEKLVIYTPSEQFASDLITDLSDEFGIDAYMKGSASDLTTGRYSDTYGARYTQQINPLVHVRKAGRTVHGTLFSRAQGYSINFWDGQDLKEFTGIDANKLAPHEAQIFLNKLEIPRATIRRLVNHSLSRAGVLEVIVESADGTVQRYALDPRQAYSMGRSTSGNRHHIPLPSEYSSRDHALIAYNQRAGIYELTDRSTNGTLMNGYRASRGSPTSLTSGAALNFGKGDKAVAGILQI